MKKNLCAFFTLALFAILATTAQAEMDHNAHQGHGDHDMQAEKSKMDHGDHDSKKDNALRHAMIDGHHVSYELIDMRAKMANMKNMPADMKSHHLMVYIKDAESNVLGNAKTGFLLIGPDGAKQKAMAMGMGGGYGADINLTTKGTYTIKTKVVAGSTKLSDSFEYKVQ